jgi:urease subunit gamma/beta
VSALSPAERDRLLLFTTAELARARQARGLRLNVPEATAIIADTVCEAARDGKRLAEAIQAGRSVLTAAEVLPGVIAAVPEVKVEATFADGTRLAVVRDPFRAPNPNGSMAPTVPSERAVGTIDQVGAEVSVTNLAEVPITVTSHFHFFEANPRLRFDRAAGYGMRLDIEAGAAVRFEPGETKHVTLTPIRGLRVVIGFAGLVDGPLDAPGAKERALTKARACGYEGA